MTSTRVHRSPRSRSFRRTGVASAAAMALLLSACGGNSSGNGGGEDGVIFGTTDSVKTLDPAECYDYYCSTILDNVGATLVSYEPGETETSPNLTKDEPEISEDGKTYTFTLRDDVEFHNGSKLTSKDVKFSLNRARWINHPEGASSLLDGIDTIETPDAQTVKIKLHEKDVTFTSKLAYNVATILPADEYDSPDEKISDDASEKEYKKYLSDDLISAGPYTLEDYRESESIELAAFDDYFGDAPKNDKVKVDFYAKPAQLKNALESSDVDVAFRNLDPQQQESLQDNDDVKMVEGEGAEIRYLVLNPYLEPFDDKDVRKAVAAAIDRDRVIDKVYKGVGDPLYSMVPPFFDDQSQPDFKDKYADKEPSDFIDHKVDVDLWYGTNHYGPEESTLAGTVSRMLEESDMFDVNVEKAPWAEFSENNVPGKSGQYPAFLLGWYPDYLDADDYVKPFYGSEGFLRMYDNPKMDDLIEQEQQADDPESDDRTKTFQQIQKLAAKDAPVIPVNVKTPVAFARKDVTGLQDTMDASQIFRYYTVQHKNQD